MSIFLCGKQPTPERILNICKKINPNEPIQQIKLLRRKRGNKERLSLWFHNPKKSTSSIFGENVVFSKKIIKKIKVLNKKIPETDTYKEIQEFRRELFKDTSVASIHTEVFCGERTNDSDKKCDSSVLLGGLLQNDGGIFNQRVFRFSIKSKSRTLSNNSIEKALKSLSESFSIKYKTIKQRPAKTPEDKRNKSLHHDLLFEKLWDELQKVEKNVSFKEDAVSFIEKNLFGTDNCVFLDIGNRKIKEITKNSFHNAIRTLGGVSMQKYGKTIKFVDNTKTDKNVLFLIRKKDSERKIMIELGNFV